jgi:hypothetical protein
VRDARLGRGHGLLADAGVSACAEGWWEVR